MRRSDTFTRLARMARLMVGIPDYEAYAAHCRRRHPERAPPTREEFVRLCAERRLGGSGSRCC